MFGLGHTFDATPRGGPKAFVSEYAVRDKAGMGNVLGAVAEAAFLIGLERNRFVFISLVIYDLPLPELVLTVLNYLVFVSLQRRGEDGMLSSSKVNYEF
ncbi:hypothetical protein RND81_05G179100 [Saponaria officinalis]|uniref:Uncharacterized protein n=1 Tax=Saponaria officinalis TaxID=3572 RepID=A0AAW1KU99_SAPOF